MNYYGISDTGNDIREDDKNEIPRGVPIIPLSEGIAILKEMVGEETKKVNFLAEELLAQNAIRKEFNHSGELPVWAIKMCELWIEKKKP